MDTNSATSNETTTATTAVMGVGGDEGLTFDTEAVRAFCAKRTYVCEKTGCWFWTGEKRSRSSRESQRDSRGRIRINGRVHYAYRIIWSLHNKQPFPKGLLACHSCDVPECVNPSHIRPGTAAENSAEAATRGRFKSRLTNDDVASIILTHQQMQGNTWRRIADVIGNPSINWWNVRDVIRQGHNVRRLNTQLQASMS